MNATLIEYYEKNIEILYVDSLKHYYFLIFVGIIVDYKEQILITKIKTCVQYSIYQVPSKKQENLTKV